MFSLGGCALGSIVLVLLECLLPFFSFGFGAGSSGWLVFSKGPATCYGYRSRGKWWGRRWDSRVFLCF